MTVRLAVTVRLALAEDTARLAEVAAATFPLACPPATTGQAIAAHIAGALSEAAFARHLADPSTVLLVAERAGSPGGPLDGYAMLIAGEPADPDVAAAVRIRPTCELSKIYVREEVHGSKVGWALMEHALREARDLGVAGVWLGTNEANARALRFYEKSGFEIVGRRRFRLADTWEQDVVLERGLS